MEKESTTKEKLGMKASELPQVWSRAFQEIRDMLGFPALSLTREGLNNQLEDGICLLLKRVLESQGSQVFLKVKGIGTPGFDTDMDVLELRENLSIAYEVKGLRQKLKGGRREKVLGGVRTLEGLEQAVNHLYNAGYSANYVYLVHPVLTFHGYLLRTAILINRYTPAGYIVVDPVGKMAELIRPKAVEAEGENLINIPKRAILDVSEFDVAEALRKRIERVSGLPIDVLKESIVKGYNIVYAR